MWKLIFGRANCSKPFFEFLVFPRPLSCSVAFVTAYRRHLILFMFMANSPSPSKRSTSPAISPGRQPPLSTPSVEVSLVPLPLSPSAARAQLAPHGVQIEKPKLRVRNPKEYSHNIARSRSLGVRITKLAKQTRTEAFYKCTLCFCTLPSTGKIFTLPYAHIDANSRKGEGSGRIFCKKCWIWIYDLSICWTCGEIVGRLEERVGFGWCWWHWGCMGCLICKVCISTCLLKLSSLLGSKGGTYQLVGTYKTA